MDLLGLLLPQRCAVCARPGEPLCSGCRAQLRRLRDTGCARCGAPTAWPVARCRECSGRRLAFASARAAVVYDRAARSLVSAWKELGLRKLAGTAADLVVEVVPRPPLDVLAFVPPDGDRLLTRGHHPARRLTLELGLRWELSVEEALSRTKPSRPQRGLSRADRNRNVAGAFRARREGLPRRVGLIDDVYTTGATASAAASALRKAGAHEIHVITFARAARTSS